MRPARRPYRDRCSSRFTSDRDPGLEESDRDMFPRSGESVSPKGPAPTQESTAQFPFYLDTHCDLNMNGNAL